MGKSAQILDMSHELHTPVPDLGPEPMLHGQLEDVVRKLRRAELLEAGHAPGSVNKAVSNTISALKAFRTVNHLQRSDLVEREIMETTRFARGCERIYNLEITSKTAERHISELNKRIRPWAISLQKQQIAHCTSLQEALLALMDMAGLSIAELARRTDTTRETLSTWTRGKETPSTHATIQAIGRIEAELGAPAGALSRFCEIKKIYMRADSLKIDLRPDDIKRVRMYLPDDFQELSAAKQQEIYDWVMTNIILSPTDDEGDEVGDREPYRCKLRETWLHVDTPGTFKAPEQLRTQVASLVAFKTAEITPIGKKRNPDKGRWTSDESLESKLILLEIFYGALKKKGTREADMSLLNILDPKKIEAFIDYMRKRRGLYTETITAVLLTLAGHTNPQFGYITQHQEDIVDAKSRVDDATWQAKCAAANSLIWDRYRQIIPLLETGRDPFLPISVVLDTKKPLHTYHAIADEIRMRTPLAAANKMQRARCLRDLIMFRYAGQFALRAGNFSTLQVLPKGAPKTSMTKLRRRRSLELWWDPKTKLWIHRQSKMSFKNHRSPATKDIEIPLENIDGLYREIEEYLKVRPLLLDGHPDPGNLFVTDMSQGCSTSTTLTPSAFTALWKSMIRRYGIYNPYTGQGAIAGLRVHPTHAARHILATHILVVDGSLSKAAAAIFDTEVVVAKRYARFCAEQQYDLAMAVVRNDPPQSSIKGRSS